MFKFLQASVLIYALGTSAAFAQEYVINVHGIVCELCSYGVAKNIRKLEFIDKTLLDKGVKVDIKNQNVYIAVRENTELNKDKLFDAIRAGGYEPISVSEKIQPKEPKGGKSGEKIYNNIAYINPLRDFLRPPTNYGYGT